MESDVCGDHPPQMGLAVQTCSSTTVSQDDQRPATPGVLVVSQAVYDQNPPAYGDQIWCFYKFMIPKCVINVETSSPANHRVATSVGFQPGLIRRDPNWMDLSGLFWLGVQQWIGCQDIWKKCPQYVWNMNIIVSDQAISSTLYIYIYQTCICAHMFVAISKKQIGSPSYKLLENQRQLRWTNTRKNLIVRTALRNQGFRRVPTGGSQQVTSAATAYPTNR